MKKLLLFLICLLPLAAFADEPLLLINPSRETFLHFPSANLPDKIVTVFLPEPSVPLHRAYPVVYVLGVIPKDAPQVQALLEKSQHKAIIVGINTEEKDLADPTKLTAFFTRDLLPYIQSNYSTIDRPEFRAIVSQDKAALAAVAALLKQKQFFARAGFWQPGTKAISLAASAGDLRVWIGGSRSEIIPLQETLQDMNLSYGPNFVTHISEPEETLWQQLDLDYLFANADEVQVKKVRGSFDISTLLLAQKQFASLQCNVLLANKKSFDYIPLTIHQTPPFLAWDATAGSLTPLSGALPGKVKIKVFVDKISWSGKIKLKKY